MKKITELVAEMAAPVVAEAGCTLWDVEYVREAGAWYLRLYIDKVGGVDILDCEKVSRAVEPLLDEADPIADAYHLEISSPGVERDIKTPAHIEFCTGEMVEARLFAPLNGSRVHTGILEGMDEEGNVVLSVGENTVAIPRSAISRMTTVFEF